MLRRHFENVTILSQTSKLQPDAAVRANCLRLADAVLPASRILPQKPEECFHSRFSGSTPLTTSIMPLRADFFREVKKPA